MTFPSGMGDFKGIMEVFQEALPMDKAPGRSHHRFHSDSIELAQRLSEGKFTLRDMHEQLQNILKMGPIGKVMEMMPGMNQFLPQLKGNDGNAKIKSMINILDSMTDEGTY
jgi:signal recognition particle subunit SRP54